MPSARFDLQHQPNQAPLGIQRLAFANPLEDALSIVEDFSKRSAVERGRQQATDAVLSGENPGPKLGLTPGGQAFNRAAEHAFAVRSESVLRSKAAELASQYDGRNPTDADAFAEIYSKTAEEVVSSVPEAWRGPIALEAQTRAQEAVSKIRGQSMQFEYQKSVKSISDGFDLDIQDAASAEQIGRTDLTEAALAKSEAKVRSLIDIGAINEDSGALMLRNGRETVAAESIYRGFITGQVSLDSVVSGEVGGELSAQHRDRLVNKMEAEIRHRRREAARAMAVQRHQLAMNSDAAEGIAAEIEAGLPMTPERQSAVNAIIEGGVPVSPKARLEVAEAFRVANIVTEATTGTVAEAQAKLLALDGAEPASLLGASIRDKSRKQIEGFISAATGDDPVGDLSARGYFRGGLPPVDFSTPDAFAQTLAQRRQAVAVGEMQSGVTGMGALAKTEGAALTRAMEGWDSEQRAIAYAGIERLGPDTAATIRDSISKNGAPALAQAGFIASKGDLSTAMAVEKGTQLIKAGLFKFEAGHQAVKTEALAPLAWLPVQTQAEIASAAEGLMASDPSLGFDDAVARVGGATATYSGFPVLLPFGVTDGGTFSDRIESVTDEEAAAMGGTPEQAAAIRAGRAKLTSRGDGRYTVAIGQSILPWELDFGQIAPKNRPGAFRRFVADPVASAVDVGLETAREELSRGGFDPSGR